MFVIQCTCQRNDLQEQKTALLIHAGCQNSNFGPVDLSSEISKMLECKSDVIAEELKHDCKEWTSNKNTQPIYFFCHVASLLER